MAISYPYIVVLHLDNDGIRHGDLFKHPGWLRWDEQTGHAPLDEKSRNILANDKAQSQIHPVAKSLAKSDADAWKMAKYWGERFFVEVPGENFQIVIAEPIIEVDTKIIFDITQPNFQKFLLKLLTEVKKDTSGSNICILGQETTETISKPFWKTASHQTRNYNTPQKLSPPLFHPFELHFGVNGAGERKTSDAGKITSWLKDKKYPPALSYTIKNAWRAVTLKQTQENKLRKLAGPAHLYSKLKL